MQERTLRVGKTMIDVYEGRSIHILDRNQEGTMTVTNAMSSEYVQNLLDWLGNVYFEKIYIYHTDGYVSEWTEDKGFKHVDKNSTELYYRFLEVCQQRRNQYLN